MSVDTRQGQLITIGLAIASVLIAVFATALILNFTADAGSQSPIAGDPPAYAAIATAILGGETPYIDVTVEHFPGALVPMVIVEGLSQITDVGFEAIWPFAMGSAFVVSVAIAIGIPTGVSSGRRYLLLSLPLLPLVLFRVEPWLMVWVVASIGFAFQSSWQKSSLTAAIASLTKGWPIVLLALPFRSGHRRIAISTGLATAIILIIVSVLPGFREGRAFEGIHTETFVGGVLLGYRGLAAEGLQLVGAAGAMYAKAGIWAIVLNIIVGLPFILLGIRALADRTDPEALTIAIGLVVLGIILSSPLFSAQFLFWLVPFVMFLRPGPRLTYLLASALTLATAIWWEPAELAWSILVLGRNGLLLALAIVWALSLNKETRVKIDLEHVS